MSSNCQSEHGDISSDDEQEIMRRNWKKNISTIEKTAFREGATSTEIESDVMFQLGFDNGYKDGFKDGYKNGSYKSTLMLLNKFNFLEDCEEN
ncbi:hypothetical protein QTP88_002803 [Uroleucon formosanum]